MQEERRPGLGDLHEFGEVGEVFLHVDDAASVIAEDEEAMVEREVDGGWLHLRAVERIDDNATRVDGLEDGSI